MIPLIEQLSESELHAPLSPIDPVNLFSNCTLSYHILITHLVDHLMSPAARISPQSLLRSLLASGFSYENHSGCSVRLPIVSRSTIVVALDMALAFIDPLKDLDDLSHITHLHSLLP